MHKSIAFLFLMVLAFVPESRVQALLSSLKQKMVEHENNERKFQRASTSFMQKLYKDLRSGSSLTQAAGRGNLNKANLGLSNTIRSFSPTGKQDSSSSLTNIQFVLPGIPTEENLRFADIRFKQDKKRLAVTRTLLMTISVMKGSNLIKDITVRRKSEVRNGYHVFDISRIVSPLVNRFHGNLNIKVTFQQANLDTHKQLDYMLNLYLENHNFMKNLLKEQQKGYSEKIKSRGKRSVRKNRRHHKNKRGKTAGRRRACQLYDFEVNFNTIEWGEWIIHPTRFNAKFCQGRCSSPIDIRHKPTNHAMLQSLMRSKQSKLIPAPCCVPTKLEPLSMMYIEYDEVVVRHHVDMIATECGCR